MAAPSLVLTRRAALKDGVVQELGLISLAFCAGRTGRFCIPGGDFIRSRI